MQEVSNNSTNNTIKQLNDLFNSVKNNSNNNDLPPKNDVDVSFKVFLSPDFSNFLKRT